METTTQTRNYIFGYTETNPLTVSDYPYGWMRTDIRYWIETTPKKGDRFCSQTLDPKRGSWNAPKKSTYSCIGIMYQDEKGHTKWVGVSPYDNKEKVKTFIETIGGIEKLNPLQKIMFNELCGIIEVKTDEFTGEVKKDYSVKWEKNYAKTHTTEVKLTFDRPDGVSLREVFKALRGLNQDKLMDMLSGYETERFGHYEGIVRVCVRGGIQLACVTKDDYLKYLASDEAQNEEQ